MIQGKYLTSMDDTGAVMEIRNRVFVDEQGFSKDGERDRFDDMAIYALAYDLNGHPVGTGRLIIDAEDHFSIGRVCVLREARGLGLGDLIMRMLLYRAQELNAPDVYISSQLHAIPFYARYGFKPYGEETLDEGVLHQKMRVTAEEIDLQGTCHCAK